MSLILHKTPLLSSDPIIPDPFPGIPGTHPTPSFRRRNVSPYPDTEPEPGDEAGFHSNASEKDIRPPHP